MGVGVSDNIEAFKRQGMRRPKAIVIERFWMSPKTDTQTEKSENQTEGDTLEEL